MRRTTLFIVAICFLGLGGVLSAQDVGLMPMAAMPDFGKLFPATQNRASHWTLVNSAPILTARAAQAPTVTKFVSPPEDSGRCSVPLREMQIPSDKDYSIEKQVPRAEALAPMPKPALPAPSCADRRE
jgi:hypothetical protein